MAASNKKVSGLTALTTIASGDLVPVVDINDLTDAATGTTKKITWGELVAAPGAIGGTTPSTGVFTALKITSGAGATKVLTSDSDGDATWETASGGGHTIQNATTPLTARANLNFTGAGVTASDNSGTSTTDVTIDTVYALTTIKGTTGGFNTAFLEATSGALSGATGTITLNIPASSYIRGVQLRVDTLVEGATTWSAAFSGGNTASICTEIALAKNTKVNSLSGGLATATTQITLTAVGPNFSAGVIRAIVYYDYFTAMASL
jgi:hypothetical protein